MSQMQRPTIKTISRRKTRKETRNLALTRNEILNAAFLQVFTHGFQGISIDDIVAKTNLTKGAFYHQFPTKLELGYALVDEVIKPMIIDRWITPLENFDNPLEGILFQMQKLIGECDPAYLKFGCPLNNLVQEMAPLDKGFRTRLTLALELWISETERHLKRAKANGFIQREMNLREVAHFIVMAHEGFFGLIKGLDDPTIFKFLYSSLKIYFDSISAK
jgi:AcrR family transcriptional regulator